MRVDMSNISIGAFTKRKKSAGQIRKKDYKFKEGDKNFQMESEESKAKLIYDGSSHGSSPQKIPMQIDEESEELPHLVIMVRIKTV